MQPPPPLIRPDLLPEMSSRLREAIDSQLTFRFAPTPNGELHLGHAFSALVTWEMAERLGGRVLLRIEDIDLGRSREQFVNQIYQDLGWLGLRWREPVRQQSEHFEIYRRAAGQLQDAGMLYPCFATRKEIAAAVEAHAGAKDPDGAPLYQGLHKHLTASEVASRKAAGEPFALRLDSAKACARARQMCGGQLRFATFDEMGNEAIIEARPERWGDAVIVRKDVPASYHLAVVVDDALQAVSHVTRGQDLLAATDLHCLLQILLGLPSPLYHHHRLITDTRGRKLAKSARDTSLRSLREQGMTANGVRQLLRTFTD